jgi:hypothetical protein
MNTHIVDDWKTWRDAVAARKPVDVPKGQVALGYYRARDGECIAFLPGDDGPTMWRSSDKFLPIQADAIVDAFSWVSMNPVSYEDAQAYADTGRWPDQIAPVEIDADLAPHERADAELSAQREAMAKWFAEVGTIKTQDQATKAGNFADVFAKLEKASDEARKLEKEPHLEAGRAVDAKWQPVVKRAGELKAWAKKATEPFLIAERARIVAEEKAAADARAKAAAEAEQRRRQAEAAGAPPPEPEAAPLPAPPPAKAKAGKVHLRTETVHEVENPAAFLRWLAAQNNLPEDFQAVLKTLGSRMVKAGLTPDGVVTKQVERAA